MQKFQIRPKILELKMTWKKKYLKTKIIIHQKGKAK